MKNVVYYTYKSGSVVSPLELNVYRKIAALAMEDASLEKSIGYLAEHLGHFLRKRERVMICFWNAGRGSLGWLMEQAVLRCEAIPVVWGPDRLWSTLLRQAFSNKTSAIIGPPLILLGLTKLIRHSGVPLYVRKVITAAYPCPDWMIDGLVKGFDCEVGGCFTLDETGAVAGFACGHSWGVHLREEEYGVDIVDGDGNPLPAGELGEMVLYPKSHPELRHPMGELGRLEREVCPCGSLAPRLLDMQPGGLNSDLIQLGESLQRWTSVLDCRLKKGESGLEIEIVCFPGEQLPKLPSAAKLVIRPWDPAVDAPFPYHSGPVRGFFG